MHPEQLKHLRKSNHVSRKIKSTTVARAAETPIQHMARLLGLRKQINVAITLKWKAQMHDGFIYKLSGKSEDCHTYISWFGSRPKFAQTK
ncbi:hypothetical protein TNCT_354541 [Trichonephila clavata]|uniref:Uncharacterized protein n=1 Tax=Trichonephila clavata TaxID=2740835 RepID=A0A8X6F1S5_TRICU|nr:hypothetical protein TNCT_354541 [Trichonephila clavata]